MYAFSHAILRKLTYDLIPSVRDMNILHKRIGKSLVQDLQMFDNVELCILAIDQMNLCKEMDDILTNVDRALFLRLNLAAGKHSIAAASYEQAQGYFEARIVRLHDDSFSKQYSLSLELYEISVVASFVVNDTNTTALRRVPVRGFIQ